MILYPLAQDCDLSEMSFNLALGQVGRPLKPMDLVLYVSTALIKTGRKLADDKGCCLRVDTSLESDEWYLCTPVSGVFSPGA